MSESSQPSISELMANHELITAAIRRAVREAVRTHALLGQPVATWENGKVVWIPPAEILARLSQEPTASIE